MAEVVLENVRVDFPIYGAQQRSLRTAIFERATGGLIQRDERHRQRVLIRALDDVSLSLREGDRLGLVGHNGSGKSTLLKTIAGIYEPVAGRVRVTGRVTTLFEMMPGLDLEDTGYENIYTSGMLLGLSREAIDRKIPQIEEVCELGEYLSLPMRTYSMGMTMRLGVALCTALDPDVLLMDEGFGAADLRFTERTATRMDEFVGRSRIIVLASHSDSLIASMCNKAALMQQGRILAFGPVEEVLDKYHLLVHGGRLTQGAATSGANVAADKSEAVAVFSENSIRDIGLDDRLTRSTGAVRFTRLVATDTEEQLRWQFNPGETVVFQFAYEVFERVSDLVLLFRLDLTMNSENGQTLQPVASVREILRGGPFEIGQTGLVELTFGNIPLMPGRYSLYAWLGPASHRFGYDVIDTNVALPKLVLSAASRDEQHFGGVVALDCKVRCTRDQRDAAA